MSDRLQGKVVIVTGAAQGIGLGCAKLAASEGVAVLLGDLQDERGESAAAEIRAAGGKAHFCHVDIKNEQECAGLIQKAQQVFGRLDGLVNNAGWFPRGTLESTTSELWDESIAGQPARSLFLLQICRAPDARERRQQHCKILARSAASSRCRIWWPTVPPKVACCRSPELWPAHSRKIASG